MFVCLCMHPGVIRLISFFHFPQHTPSHNLFNGHVQKQFYAHARRPRFMFTAECTHVMRRSANVVNVVGFWPVSIFKSSAEWLIFYRAASMYD